MAKLTEKSIEALQPKAADYVVFDSEVIGFGVRVQPHGGPSCCGYAWLALCA